MLFKGAEIIINCLMEQGVDTVFGYPGGSILEVYDALFRHKDNIRHILTAHEQGAAHAADGYARSSGKVGVCLATSGPGATNLVTGIATAYMDSIPMVIFTVNVAVSSLGKDSFQEVDIAGITMPVTKHNFIVKEITQLADTIRRAFQIARSGRQGPVLVDITKDVTSEEAEFQRVYDHYIPFQEKTVKKSNITEQVLLRMEQMIRQAKRPVILAGGGIGAANAQKEFLEFVDKADAPVADTLMGKGAFPGEDERYLGMAGMHGTKSANLCIADCDLLIALGTRFSERITANAKIFASKAKIIQIDIDAAEINKNISVELGIVGQLKEVLHRYNQIRRRSCRHREWMQVAAAWKKKYPMTVEAQTLNAPYIIDTLHQLTKGEVILCTEVGQHQMWAAQYYKFHHPRSLITSGGLGTMGFGLGAAVGAQLANPDKKVVNIAGDGCFRMNMNELATVTGYQLPIIELLLDNGSLGMVRQIQSVFYQGRHSETDLNQNINYIMLAEAMGMKAFQITKPKEVGETLQKALSLNQPVFIHCIIEKEDMVWPVVFPGAALSETYRKEEYEAHRDEL